MAEEFENGEELLTVRQVLNANAREINALDASRATLKTGVAVIGIAPDISINNVDVDTVGTYPLYGGLQVTAEDLDGKIVEFRKIDGAWTKHVSLTSFANKEDLIDMAKTIDLIITGETGDIGAENQLKLLTDINNYSWALIRRTLKTHFPGGLELLDSDIPVSMARVADLILVLENGVVDADVQLDLFRDDNGKSILQLLQNGKLRAPGGFETAGGDNDLTNEIARFITPNASDLHEDEDDGLLRGNRVSNASSSHNRGAIFKQLGRTKTPLLYGFNNTGEAIHIRKSTKIPIRGIKYMGEYAVPNILADRQRGGGWTASASSAPDMSNPVAGNFQIVGTPHNGNTSINYLGVNYRRGDLIVHNGTTWVKKAAPAMPEGEAANIGYWWRVTNSGNFNGVDYVPGDIIYCISIASGAGPLFNYYTKQKEGEFFFREEFAPSTFSLPANKGNAEVYQALADGTYNSEVFKNGDLLLIEGTTPIKVETEAFKVVEIGKSFNYSTRYADEIEWRLASKRDYAFRVTAKTLNYFTHSTLTRTVTSKNIRLIGNSHAGMPRIAELLQAMHSDRLIDRLSYGGGQSFEIFSMLMQEIRNGLGEVPNRIANTMEGDSFLFIHDSNNIADLGQCKEFAYEFVRYMGAFNKKYCFITPPGGKVMQWNAARNMLETIRDGNYYGMLEMEDFYTKQAFPNNSWNYRKALIELSKLSNLPDLQHPGFTEAQMAQQDIIALSFYMDFDVLGFQPGQLSFLGYRTTDSTTDLPANTIGNNYDYYLLNGTNNTVAGSLNVKLNGVWTYVGYDRAHPRPLQSVADKINQEILISKNF